MRLPSDKKCADDEIAERVVKILSWDPTLPPNRIYVRVDYGLVMLRGSVEMPFQVEEAELQVRKLSGVVSVINEIRVRPREVPIDIAKRIEAALHRSAEIGTRNIGVGFEYSKVILTGTVNNWHHREAAGRIARLVPDVDIVENQLVLEPQR